MYKKYFNISLYDFVVYGNGSHEITDSVPDGVPLNDIVIIYKLSKFDVSSEIIVMYTVNELTHIHSNYDIEFIISPREPLNYYMDLASTISHIGKFAGYSTVYINKKQFSTSPAYHIILYYIIN